MTTVEPRFNEVAGDRPNLFVKWRVRYIEVLFHTFYCNFGRDIEIISFVISRTSLNRGSLNRGSTVTDLLVTMCTVRGWMATQYHSIHLELNMFNNTRHATQRWLPTRTNHNALRFTTYAYMKY